VQQQVVAVARTRHRQDVRLCVLDHRDMRDHGGVEDGVERGPVGDRLLREAADPGAFLGRGHGSILAALVTLLRASSAGCGVVAACPAVRSTTTSQTGLGGCNNVTIEGAGAGLTAT
jgi:hypothetical protein